MLFRSFFFFCLYFSTVLVGIGNNILISTLQYVCHGIKWPHTTKQMCVILVPSGSPWLSLLNEKTSGVPLISGDLPCSLSPF